MNRFPFGFSFNVSILPNVSFELNLDFSFKIYEIKLNPMPNYMFKRIQDVKISKNHAGTWLSDCSAGKCRVANMIAGR